MTNINEQNEDRRISLNLRHVPAELRNRFKSFCSQHELTMTGAITQFMEDVVNGGPSRDFLFSEKT
jgi:hypothetical protein